MGSFEGHRCLEQKGFIGMQLWNRIADSGPTK
jgi:hypothetical protein